MKNVFSFRVECSADAEAIRKMDKCKSGIWELVSLLPEIDGYHLYTNDNLFQVRNCMIHIEDGHRIIQTLQQCEAKDNTAMPWGGDWFMYQVVDGVVYPADCENLKAYYEEHTGLKHQF